MDHSKSQKRAAVIGLAVAATVSVVSVTFSRLHAEDASLDSSAIRPLSLQAEAATDLDLLKQAVSQYKNKQYEDAKASLDKVNAGNLSGSDQSKLASVAADVDRALEGRKDARAKFAEGQTALEAGNTATAKPLYEAARDARYADDATRQKAKEQLALIADMQQQKAAEQKASYQQAKKDLEAGNYAEAQAKFTKLQQEGFKAPLFQTSPESFLKEIEKKTAAPAAAAPAPAPDQAAADKAAAAAAAKAAEEKADADKKAAELAAQEQKQKANEAYKAGLAALKANDFAAARASFTAADQAGFKPGIFEASAAKMLAEVDRKEADSKAKAEGLAAAPAPAPAPAVDQAAADKAAADAAAKAAEEKAAADKAAADLAAKDQKQKANEAYKAGLAALKANDFAAARASFKTADESGFRPGLFEASAAKMLAEVDRKETEAKAAAEGTAAADQAAADKAKQEAERKAAADKAAADQAAANLAAKEQKQKANDAYKTGLAALRANDFAAARASFKTADESGFRPGLFEASAAKMLAEVDRKEAEAQAKTAQAAAPAPAPVETPAPAVTPAPAPAVTPAPAATPAPAPVVDPEAQAKADKAAAEAAARAEKEAAAARQVAARDQYKAGLAALKAGDYATARTSFKAADESGFKPGLFEASAAKMLAEVDQVEADAKAKAERTAAREAEKAERERVKTEKAAAEAQAKADKQAAEATALANKEAVEVKPGETPAKVEESSPARQQLEATAKMDQIRQQARAYESQRLTEQAQAAQAEGRVATALESYNKAVEADPSNQVAVDGRNQLLALQGRPAMPTTLLEDQQKLNQVRRESIAFAFNDAIDRTRASIAAENYKAAQLQLDSAVVAREQDPNLFTRDEVAQMDATIAQTQVELRQGREAFERAERQRVADAKAATERERLRLEEEERRNTIAALVKDSRRYISQNKYPEALATIDQIVAIDPNNDYASAVRPLVEDRALLQEQRKYREDFNRQYQRQMTQAEEKKIPYGDIYRYPENWPDIVDARDRFVIEERGQKAGDRELQLLLEKRLPEVKIEGQPFDEVINFLRDLTGANIVVRWAALEQAAIDRKTPVNVNLRDVKFSKVLKTVLESVSNDPNTRLTYTVSEGVITIYVTQEASAEAAALDTRVYDITDLMYVIPEYQDLNTGNAGGGGTGGGGGTNTGGGRSGTSSGSGSSRSSGGGSSRSSGGGGRSSGRSSGGGGRSTSGGGGGLFGGGGGGGYGGGGRGGTSGGGTGGGGLSTDSFTRMEDVRYLITETVNVDSWDDNGGPGSARPSPLQKHLIITQTPEVHANIEKLLAQLREAKAIQVTVETRFLKVNRNFLEDIGMDFDFAWNFNGGPNAKWSPIGVSQNSSDFTANPNTGIPGTLAGNTPSPSATIGAPGGGAGTYLDDFQVNFLIRATQATVNQAVVTAPRVTVYNGGAAVVWVTTSSPYVASLTPEVASGVVGYTPEIETADDGIELAVQAFVSHDRKYVTLYLEPTLTDVISIQNFSYQEASTLPTGGSGVGNVFTSQPTLTIQEPVTEEIGVQTTVNVPDGGTLLLGGQTVAGEIEREAGVPVLSKIPILKRFFTNRSMAKDENVLLILVKPTIIIQQEQEAKQFPLLSSKISGQ